MTIENATLNAPGLVDPETGLPLNGKLNVYLSSNHVIDHLDADEQVPFRYTASRTDPPQPAGDGQPGAVRQHQLGVRFVGD